MEWVCYGGDALPLNTDLECTVLKNNVYVKFEQGCAKLFVASISDLNHWTQLSSDLPTCDCALTTYQSQLVLVGGIETSTGLVTNKLWTSDTGHDWQSSLPPMPTPRRSPSAIGIPECLVVASGFWTDQTSMEVLIEKHWATIEIPLSFLYGFTIHNERFYLNCAQIVYYCDVKSLMVSCTRTNQSGPLWSEMLSVKVPNLLASLGKRLIAIGDLDINAYSPFLQSWAHVSSLHVLGVVLRGSVVLPTGNLLVFAAGENSWQVYQATLNGKYILADSLHVLA